MRQARPLVLLENIDVDIDGRRVLQAIDLALYPGQHTGIVGDNGSGKSTLLALIGGLRWPAPGRGRRTYDFGDGPERDAITARRRIVVLGHELQDLYRARHWNFRARDVVLSGLTRSDIPQRRVSREAVAAADALLDSMALSALADRRLLELSRGEQRRVLITRALAFEPAMLLLDEPASGLDAAARADLEVLLTRIARTTQIVTAAHRAEQLPAVTGTVIELERGRIVDRPAIAAPQSVGAASGPETGHLAAGENRAPALRSGRALIELAHASIWLGERRILEDLNWSLEPGDSWLITGANGAGKSTFLRLLHGQLRPALGGSIRWPGLGDPVDVWTLRQQIALVSAELAAGYLYPSTVFETIASGFRSSIGLTRPVSAAERKQVEALLAAFELDGLRDRNLRALSYGQRQRTLIARTLCTEPRVVLLDEPWEGLDRHSARLVATELGRRMRHGLQIVCASHLGPGALPLNRTAIIRNAKLEPDSAGESALRDGDDARAALRGSSASARRPARDSRPR